MELVEEDDIRSDSDVFDFKAPSRLRDTAPTIGCNNPRDVGRKEDAVAAAESQRATGLVASLICQR